MTTPHKHAAVIHAYADGAVIQWRRNANDGWQDLRHPSFLEDYEYRSKPVVARYRRYVRRHHGRQNFQYVDTAIDATWASDIASIERSEDFVRWIDTEWQEEAL
jgi:hypothetical protein